jgi:hypothetical protein
MIDAKGKVTGGILCETAHPIGVMVGRAAQVEAIPFARFESLISQQDFDFTFVNQHQVMTGAVIFPKALSITQLGLIFLKKNKFLADCAKRKSIAHTSQNSDALQTLSLRVTSPV